MDSEKTEKIVSSWYSAMGSWDFETVMNTLDNDVVFILARMNTTSLSSVFITVSKSHDPIALYQLLTIFSVFSESIARHSFAPSIAGAIGPIPHHPPVPLTSAAHTTPA